MARVLILSSFVAASRVGGGAQALALARLGIEPILVPTALFGRHPGHGAPGGAAVEPEVFEAMLGGVEAQGLFGQMDAVITGHFSSAEQVAIAAEAVARVKRAAAARVIVDPIMGDADKGLYVREPVAEALAAELVPAADIVAPNAWELARLAGCDVADVSTARAAARALGKDVLVSSIREDGRIGAAWLPLRGEAHLASHPLAHAAPKGTGDLLTAIFAAALVQGKGAVAALEAAVGVVDAAVAAAAGLDELPLDAFPASLASYPRISLQRLDG